DPLPFRLKSPDKDSFALDGIASVSSRIDGLLQLTEAGVLLEWRETRTTDRVSFERIGTDVEELPTQWLELPFERIAGAWVIGGWWRPRMELRARGLDDFAGVPGSRGVTQVLQLHRRDRALALAMAAEIHALAEVARLEPGDRPQLDEADPEWQTDA
ncbi:MAG TPA: hypothetical protein VFX50_17655, partial [Gemmatimonadales bacterium]|nr:hypothetical protein [Gemmatimonadales bacterium]